MRTLRMIAIGAFALMAGGCAATTIDSSVTEVPAVDTTTTLPSGTPAELMPALLGEVGKLSDIIGTDGDRGRQMEIIQRLFDAVRVDVAETDGLAAASFDAAIDLCKRATQFKRPADADKCFRNLSVLTESYLADHP